MIFSLFILPTQASIQAGQDVIELGRYGAHFASIGYCNDTLLNKKECRLCNQKYVGQFQDFENVYGLGQDKWQGVVAYNPVINTIAISFRGSSNIEAWIQNLETDMIPLPSDKNIMIHRGWTGVAKNLTATLSPIVERKLQQYPDANFLFSGHSSGAAWSALIAYYGVQPDGFLSRLGVAVQRVNLVTIGGPRLGNQAFVDSINNIGFSHVLRVVKSADPVAVLPPQTLFNFYAHDEELFINSVKESGDNVPVFCEDQQPSKVDGSCDKRLNAAQILLKGVDEFKQQHLFYLDIKLGDNSCV